MATEGTVFNVGIGIFILASVWVLALSVCILFARSPTSISSLGPLAVFGAILITVILIFIPREIKEAAEEDQSVVYDYSIVYRSSLVAVMSLAVLVGAVLYLVQHMMQPVLAKPLRKFLR